MRDLHPDFATAVATSEISPAILTFLDFEGQPLRAWTGLGPLEWNGQIFLGLASVSRSSSNPEHLVIAAELHNLKGAVSKFFVDVFLF
jgi:hypothetical protein